MAAKSGRVRRSWPEPIQAKQAADRTSEALTRLLWDAGSRRMVISSHSRWQQVERHREHQVHVHDQQPINQAERPLLVTSDAVMVAISIITTAPGQNCRSIG